MCYCYQLKPAGALGEDDPCQMVVEGKRNVCKWMNVSDGMLQVDVPECMRWAETAYQGDMARFVRAAV